MFNQICKLCQRTRGISTLSQAYFVILVDHSSFLPRVCVCMSLWQAQNGVKAKGAIQATGHDALWAAGESRDHMGSTLPRAPERIRKEACPCTAAQTWRNRASLMLSNSTNLTGTSTTLLSMTIRIVQSSIRRTSGMTRMTAFQCPVTPMAATRGIHLWPAGASAGRWAALA